MPEAYRAILRRQVGYEAKRISRIAHAPRLLRPRYIRKYAQMDATANTGSPDAKSIRAPLVPISFVIPKNTVQACAETTVNTMRAITFERFVGLGTRRPVMKPARMNGTTLATEAGTGSLVAERAKTKTAVETPQEIISVSASRQRQRQRKVVRLFRCHLLHANTETRYPASAQHAARKRDLKCQRRKKPSRTCHEKYQFQEEETDRI
jgi:hypothetical protein